MNYPPYEVVLLICFLSVLVIGFMIWGIINYKKEEKERGFEGLLKLIKKNDRNKIKRRG